MSFGDFIFFAGLFQKRAKRRIELHKKNETCLRRNIHHRTQEDTRRHKSEAELQKVLEGPTGLPPMPTGLT
jgi:hypothetical protein